MAGIATEPLKDTIRISRSIADGSDISFELLGLRSNLAHVVRGAAVQATDVATGDLLFAGNVLDATAKAFPGSGTLVTVHVKATGVEQRIYGRRISFSQARALNNATAASDQLAEIVSILGSGYSAGTVDANVNAVARVRPGVSIGAILRSMGDTHRISPAGVIDLIARADLTAIVDIVSANVLPASRYTVNLDSTIGRVIAYGAPVEFIATGTLQRVTDGGVTRAVATITPPANTEVERVTRVTARAAIAGKFGSGDNLDGVWDPDEERFEWSGTLAAGESATVEMQGTWRAEDIVDAADPDPLARDLVIDVPVTTASVIRAAANRELEQQGQPLELLDLVLVLGATVPPLVPGDAVTVAEALQDELDVYLPVSDALWLVDGTELVDESPTQPHVILHLSRRLPDYRDRDFSRGPETEVGDAGGRQIVVGAGGGAPQTSQVIPAQQVIVGGDLTLDLGQYFDDPDGDTLTYVATSSDTSVVTVSVVGAELTVTGVGAGSASITVTASDASRSAAQIFVTAAVTNRAPVASQSAAEPDGINGAHHRPGQLFFRSRW